MIALDFSFAESITRLGELKDGMNVELSPNDEWAKHHFELMGRNQEAYRKKSGFVNDEIRESILKLVRLPIFQLIKDLIISANASLLNALDGIDGIFYESVLNALTASQASGKNINISTLIGSNGILCAITNVNSSNFDPKDYVKCKALSHRTFFLSDPTQLKEGEIQRGKGFHNFGKNPQVCIYFDCPDNESLMTCIFIPYSLRLDAISSDGLEKMNRAAVIRYLELAALVNFDFSKHSRDHNPPYFPDMSDRTIDALRDVLSRERPDLLSEFERIIKIELLTFHPLRSFYLSPEKYLL